MADPAGPIATVVLMEAGGDKALQGFPLNLAIGFLAMQVFVETGA